MGRIQDATFEIEFLNPSVGYFPSQLVKPALDFASLCNTAISIPDRHRPESTVVAAPEQLQPGLNFPLPTIRKVSTG